MKLLDLQPVWLTEHLLAFKCPHCRKFWLTCKDVRMSHREQFERYESFFGEDWNKFVVPCKASYSWKFSSRDLSSITITPSIDASKSGCWHGYITEGMVR